MARTIQQTIEFEGVGPGSLFAIYVDERQHAAAIRAPASIRDEVGAGFTIFGPDGLRGRNLAIVADRMIVQSWRAANWHDGDLDSILVLSFSTTPRGARVDLVQANVPDHVYETIDDGWVRHYWNPWREYLNARKA